MTLIHKSPEYIKKKNKDIINENNCSIENSVLYSLNNGKFKVTHKSSKTKNGESIMISHLQIPAENEPHRKEI